MPGWGFDHTRHTIIDIAAGVPAGYESEQTTHFGMWIHRAMQSV